MENLYDVIIIGSGPAGLSAAIYAKRAKLSSLTIEANFASGGQVLNTYEVDNYPGLPGISGMDLGSTLRAHAEKMGAEFSRERVKELVLDEEIKIVRTRKNEYHAKTVILATGAEHRALNVPGEKELSGMGVSYCATCDGAFFKDKTVAVIGGGDVAVEDAIFLARTCKKVYVIHRRDELRAAGVLQDALLALPNVEMVWDTVVDSIEGNEMVSGVKVTNKKAGEAGVITVDGVFIAVGIVPVSALIAGTVETDEAGYIKAGEDGVTSVPGVFAAGRVDDAVQVAALAVVDHGLGQVHFKADFVGEVGAPFAFVAALDVGIVEGDDGNLEVFQEFLDLGDGTFAAGIDEADAVVVEIDTQGPGEVGKGAVLRFPFHQDGTAGIQSFLNFREMHDQIGRAHV